MRISSITKNAGKACNNRLYRHIRTFKKIVKNYFVISYKYEKMYVVRPQCFIPIITLLRNAAMNAMEYKQELAVVRNQNIDISDFEEKLMNFKSDFSRNYDIAHSHFDKAVDEIDKTIQHLEKVKKELLGSDNQLRIANNKVDEVSIKKLTRGNKTMQEKFEELKQI